MIAGMDATRLAVLAAVGVGAVLAAALGWIMLRSRRAGRIESPEDAAQAVEQMLVGARVAGAVVGADGGGALAVTEDGRVAAVKRRGNRLVAREVPWRNVRSTAQGILVETGDARLGEVALAGVDALDIRRLAPRLTR
ncbi:hypothetical protein Q5H91_15745 [Sphingomonas sp. KR1UV-12]|uniref:Uncharacterized protein n=1 Tax=Sphingomonas aurea TaxID=3063994 RepID=A0ABT9ENZ6_9SPHN|nr:hypothetical protein [Sphingomonas sp. KR1UV-12]MDP1028674.1 hypothetical protein [Sphingomonas sp. KR1UV-12]